MCLLLCFSYFHNHNLQFPWGYSCYNWRIVVLQDSSTQLWWLFKMPFFTLGAAILGNNFLEVFGDVEETKSHLSSGPSFSTLVTEVFLITSCSPFFRLKTLQSLNYQFMIASGRDSTRSWPCFTILIIFFPSIMVKKLLSFFYFQGTLLGKQLSISDSCFLSVLYGGRDSAFSERQKSVKSTKRWLSCQWIVFKAINAFLVHTFKIKGIYLHKVKITIQI